MAAPVQAGTRLLIVDDQADVLEALRLLLKPEGYAIETAKAPGAALKAVEARDFAAALMDLNYTRDTTSGHRRAQAAYQREIGTTLEQNQVTLAKN